MASPSKMYFVYIIESINTGMQYVGFTPDTPTSRLLKHNNGLVSSTKKYLPWKIIYYEAYLTRQDATGREKFLKSGAGRRFIKKQLKYYLLASESMKNE